MLNSSVRPYLYVIGASVIWSSSATLIKLMELPPSALTWVRCLIPTLIAACMILKLKRQFPSRNKTEIWFASLGNAVRMYLFVLALEYTSVGRAIVVCYSSPIFSTIFARLFLNEPVSLRSAAAITCGFLGVISVYSGVSFTLDNHFIGMTLMLCSAIVYAAVNVAVKEQLKTFSLNQTLFTQNLAGALIFLPLGILNNDAILSESGLMALGYSILIGYVGFGLYYKGLKEMSVAPAVALTYLEVFFSILFGIFILGEDFTISVAIGAILIVISGLLTTFTKRAKTPISPTTP